MIKRKKTNKDLSKRKFLEWAYTHMPRPLEYLETIFLNNRNSAKSYLNLVFYSCLFITILAAGNHVYKYNIFQRQHNKQLVSKFNTQIDETFHRYFSMIYGVKALFSMSPDLTSKQWHPFSHQIIYPKRYPGIHGIGIIKPVLRKNLSQFLEQDKRVNNRTLQISSPETSDFEELSIIQYYVSIYEGDISTHTQYSSVVNNSDKHVAHHGKAEDGINVRQYHDNHLALNASRDEDKSKMIYRQNLIYREFKHLDPVFIIYSPIYKANTPINNVLSRRENFYGWVTTTIYIKELFQELLESDSDFNTLIMKVSLNGSNNTLFSVKSSMHYDTSVFPQTLTKNIAGLQFKIHTKHIYNGFTLYHGRVIIPNSLLSFLIIAMIITLLIMALFWSILTMRQRAVNIANHITTDLFKQEQKYRTLIQNAPGVIFSCAPERNWRMTYLSEQFKRITGFNPKDFLDNKRRYIEIIHPDDLIKIEKTIGLKPKINHEYFLEYRIIHKDMSIRWMHERAKVVRSPETKELHLTGHFFDITSQKEKESEYRNLVNALENAVNGVAFIKPNGYHTSANEAYSEVFETTPQDLQYKNFFDFLNKRDQIAIKKIFDNLYEKKRDVINIEAKTTKGKSIYLSMVIVPAYSDHISKVITGFYMFAKDVSNEARREQQLSNAVKAAESANQAKSIFLATMSHELRTPLNAIIGYSDMLMEDTEDVEDANNKILLADLSKINHSGRHLLTLINDILDVSKLEAGKTTVHLETFDIKETIQSILNICYPDSKKNDNKIILNVPDDIGIMYSDLTKLRQMIFNLLGNACKFTKKGKININIAASTENSREFIKIDISDSGIGITEEQMKKLFKPFSQADSSTTRNFGGTGLGLTITKKFAIILGGKISVSSKKNVGTTFTIILPRNTRQDIKNEMTA